MANHHTAVVLKRMNLKTDPLVTIPLEGDDVEGMQRGRCRAGIDACLNRRQSKPWQGAPLLTADDEFVGQGRCGSLSRGREILELLQPFQPTDGTNGSVPIPQMGEFSGLRAPSNEGVFRPSVPQMGDSNLAARGQPNRGCEELSHG